MPGWPFLGATEESARHWSWRGLSSVQWRAGADGRRKDARTVRWHLYKLNYRQGHMYKAMKTACCVEITHESEAPFFKGKSSSDKKMRYQSFESSRLRQERNGCGYNHGAKIRAHVFLSRLFLSKQWSQKCKGCDQVPENREMLQT
jgi:hypothetical protein